MSSPALLNDRITVPLVRFVLPVLFCVFLVGCSSGESKVEDQLAIVETNLQGLRSAINSNGLRNATFIRQYASILKLSEISLGLSCLRHLGAC